jgi:5-methylcytosine-specific restriction enzyme subunit McrC
MQTIRVFEHECLTIHKDEFDRAISQIQFEKLCQFNDKNENKYFTIIRNGIKFGQYVGVIQIGTLTIEILPKVDKERFYKKEFENESVKWQKVLLKMLSISGEIDLETVSEASLRKRFTLLDLYFEMYLSEVDELVRKGLAKKYRDNSGDVKALKGRLLFSKNIQHNLIHQERFFTTHQTYDHEHLINQVLLRGLTILKKVSTYQLLNDKINRLLFYFPEMHEIHITKESFDKIRLTPKTREYSKALSIAKMFILNYSPDISRGEDDMLALLFDMNQLWEKYIYKKLKAKENSEMTVSYHDQDDFWESKRVFPDIVIRNKKTKINLAGELEEYWEPYVIDTKWKLVNPSNPSDDDLKQMYVYNMYWDSPKSILLYPKTNETEDGKFGSFHKGRPGENKCKLGFVHVLNSEGTLNHEIADEVLIKLKTDY